MLLWIHTVFPFLMSDFIHKAKIVAGIVSNRVLTGPHSVAVSIVDACNYRCIMCWEHSSELDGWGADKLAKDYHDQKKFKSTVMDIDLYKDFITSLSRTGTRQLGISGIGEPLLHKDIVEAVAFAKSKGINVWITTNGSRLSPDLMAGLAEAGLDDLSVSTNGGAAAEYGLVHSNQEGDKFDEIVDNLVWLKNYRQERGTSLPRTSLSNVVSNLNCNRILEMMETGVKAGAVSVSYRPIDVFPGADKYSLSQQDIESITRDFKGAEELAARNGITTNTNIFSQLLDLRQSDFIPAPCFAGWLYPFVMANGDVTYCCVSREVLGNLTEQSFEEIWFSRDRKHLNSIALNIHKTQQPVPKSRCVGCEQMLSNLKIYRRLWPLWGKPGRPASSGEASGAALSG